MIYPLNKWFVWRKDFDSLNSQIKELIEEKEGLLSQLNELNKKIEELSKGEIIECPSYGLISYTDAYNLLRNALQCYNINLSDEFFNLPKKDDAEAFTKATKVFYRKWVKEDHDCDNFSFALMGYWSQGLISHAFGVAWSEGHAFNILIDKDKKIWIVEPQTNMYYTIDEIKSNPMYYPVRLIIM